jgi:hypothetical protein
MIVTATVSDWLNLLTPIAVAVAIILQRMQANKSDNKLSAIHGLVNGNMGEQKRVTMLQAQRIAYLTKDPADMTLAADAKHSYDEHMANLNSLNAKKAV